MKEECEEKKCEEGECEEGEGEEEVEGPSGSLSPEAMESFREIAL